VDFHNVFSRWAASVGRHEEAADWVRLERETLMHASLVTVCSVEEQAALEHMAGCRVAIAPHGVDPAEWPETALGDREEPTVALFGGWAHEPNRLALEWFAADVWTRVRSAVPAARLLVAGPGAPPAGALVADGVERVGRADDLAALLGAVRVAV